MNLYDLIGNSIRRRPGRNGLAAAGVAVAVAINLAGSVIVAAVRRGGEFSEQRLGADLVAAPDEYSFDLERAYLTGEAAHIYMDREVEEKIAAFDFVEQTSPQLFIQALTDAPGGPEGIAFLIGFEPGTDFTVRPWLARRRHVELGPDDALVGADFQLQTGDTVRFYGHRFRVAGKLDPSGSDLDRSCFIPLDAAYHLADPLSFDPGAISTVMIKLKPPGPDQPGPAEAAYRLNKGVYEIRVVPPEQMLRRIHRNLAPIQAALRAAGLALWPATALIVGLVLAMAAAERRREIALLRGLGATRAQVFGLLLAEAAVIATIGALIGTVASFALIAVLAPPLSWPGPADLAIAGSLTFITALIAAMAAAAVPAFSAARRDD